MTSAVDDINCRACCICNFDLITEIKNFRKDNDNVIV